MGRYVDVDDLVTSTEIAQELGVSHMTVLNWAGRRQDMPAPVRVVGPRKILRLWLWSEITEWLGIDQPRRFLREPPTRLGPDELISGAEIAELLGWSSSGTAAGLARKGTFPKPVIDKPRGKLWRRSDVLAWAANTPRRPGRRTGSS